LIAGYYIVMGGLVVDVREFHDEYTRVTITPEGILQLAEAGVFFEILDEDINDKSKADIFAKAIVIFQVIWMIVQTCGRLANKLPVTVLEGHTLVHVATALAMYVLWFNKSLNVSEPTLVTVPEESLPTVALMLMRNMGFGAKALHVPSGKSGPLTMNFEDTSESAYLRTYRCDEVKKSPPARVSLIRKYDPDRPSQEKMDPSYLALPGKWKAREIDSRRAKRFSRSESTLVVDAEPDLPLAARSWRQCS
jgi:hypothetical protein